MNSQYILKLIVNFQDFFLSSFTFEMAIYLEIICLPFPTSKPYYLPPSSPLNSWTLSFALIAAAYICYFIDTYAIKQNTLSLYNVTYIYVFRAVLHGQSIDVLSSISPTLNFAQLLIGFGEWLRSSELSLIQLAY